MITTDGRAYGIAELASMFEITPRTIRFYEDQGLLAPKRVGKTRIFGDRDRVRLDFILRGKRLGFSLADIRDWLDLYDLEDGKSRQFQRLAKECRRRIEELERQREDIDRTLRELTDIEAIALQQMNTEMQVNKHANGQRRRAAAGQKGQMR